MSPGWSADEIALQFLVQDFFTDLARYYERYRQRELYSESLQALDEDINTHVLEPHDPGPGPRRELQSILQSMRDELNQSNRRETKQMLAYYRVFHEWCDEKLDRDAGELLEAGTEDKAQASRWLELLKSNAESLADADGDPDRRREYQNRLTERWKELRQFFAGEENGGPPLP